MSNYDNYYIINKKALPEVLYKVVQAKNLLEKEKALTIQEAVDIVGISRSSFYKYKDCVFPFYENSRGSVITIALGLDDEPGLLSTILNKIAEHKANILTINQTIPINGVANVTLSIEILKSTNDVQIIINSLEDIIGVHHVKILARE